MTDPYTPTTEEYTPTDAEMRQGYINALGRVKQDVTPEDEERRGAAYDRALATHDAAVRQKALEEIAAHLEKPNMLWWGQAGALVYDDDEHMNSGRKPTEIVAWLRDRAAVTQTTEGQSR